MNVWRFTSTPPYAFMAWCFNEAQGQLDLYFVLFTTECSTGMIWSIHRVTCVYLACKVEEFNISIQQFVANIKGDREKASDIILNDELLLMQQLNFHLTIHNPYRPVTGLLIHIKVCMVVRSVQLQFSQEKKEYKCWEFYRIIVSSDCHHLSFPISSAPCI
jgi:cyclin ccl1